MTKAIAPVEARLNLPAETDGLAKYGASDGGTESLGDFLRCNGKSGVVTYGSQGTELAPGTKAAALLGLAKAGFIRWEDGKPVEQGWLRLVDGPDLRALRQTLGDTNPDHWTETTLAGLPQDPFKESVMLPLVRWPDGKLMTYSTSSASGVRAVKRLVLNCVAQMRASPATAGGRAPLVELSVGFYLHPSKAIGKIFYLMMDVCDWIPAGHVMHALAQQGDASALGVSNAEALNADLGPEPSAAEPAAPPKKARAKTRFD